MTNPIRWLFPSLTVTTTLLLAAGCGGASTIAEHPANTTVTAPVVAVEPVRPPARPDVTPRADRRLVRIAAAGGNVFALGADGVLHADEDPQRAAESDHPVEPGATVMFPGAVDLAGISAGTSHVCGWTHAGTVLCLGSDEAGQLGDGAMEGWRVVPVPVPGLASVVSVSAGAAFTCAVLGDGSVQCWGDNNKGQMGDGAPEHRTSPGAVAGLSNVVEVAAGEGHACARLRDGTVKCWGSNEVGQRGGRADAEHPLLPNAVEGLTDVTALAAGAAHTCALRTDGTVWCWGSDSVGQLGDGGSADRMAPARVGGLERVAGIAAQGTQTCARLRDGSVQCWGSDVAEASWAPDQACARSASACQRTPTPVPGVDDALDLSLSSNGVCALRVSDVVRCWGSARHQAADLTFDRAPRACIPAEQRAQGTLLGAWPDASASNVAYCLCADYVYTSGLQGCGCWNADLVAGRLTPVAPLPATARNPARDGADTTSRFEARPHEASVDVCERGTDHCHTVRPQSYHPPDPDDSLAQRFYVNDAGTLLAFVHAAAGGGDSEEPERTVDTYDVARGRKIASFRVHSQAYGTEISSAQFLGDTLLVEQCAAGPACEGRLVNPRNGRVLVEVGVNMYGGVPFRVDGDTWAFFDGWGAGVAWFNVRTGRRTRPALELPAAEADRGVMFSRRSPTEVIAVYGGGANEFHGTEQPVGGDVVKVTLTTGSVMRLSPEVCGH